MVCRVKKMTWRENWKYICVLFDQSLFDHVGVKFVSFDSEECLGNFETWARVDWGVTAGEGKIILEKNLCHIFQGDFLNLRKKIKNLKKNPKNLKKKSKKSKKS